MRLASCRSARLLLVGLFCAAGSTALAGPADDKLLPSLPAEERALRDTVDHWGLPFADQLRRFTAAVATQRQHLGAAAPQGFVVGVQHGLEKVPKNKYWFKGRYSNEVAIEAAQNEYEGFQVAVLPETGKRLAQVTLAPAALVDQAGHTIPAEALRIYRVAYVRTLRAAYPSLYTGLWPDGLLANGPMSIGGTDLGLFWVEIKVPRDAAPGTYRGRLTLAADGQQVPVHVQLDVFGFALPDRVPLPIVVWTSAVDVGGNKMPVEDYRQLLAVMLEHGLDPASIGREFYSLDKPDFAVLDQNLEFCFARGLQKFEIANPGSKLERLKPLVEHLRSKGWLSKALVYSNQDEPDPEQLARDNVPYYRQFKAQYPDLSMYLASQYHPGIDQACDVWMTDVSTGAGPEFARRNHGKAELWFYYCHLPIHTDFFRPLVQAPNMQIDNEAIEQRVTLWLAWKYQTPGMFIWAGNREWANKELDRSQWETQGWRLSDKPYAFPYGGIHNGNGYLVYPGPSPSLRMKLLRDGLEDYGYLAELKRRVRKGSPAQQEQADRLLAIPPAVLVDAHYFNRDPRGLLDTRRQIGRLIEALRP
jgi:hypothetical protein